MSEITTPTTGTGDESPSSRGEQSQIQELASPSLAIQLLANHVSVLKADIGVLRARLDRLEDDMRTLMPDLR